MPIESLIIKELRTKLNWSKYRLEAETGVKRSRIAAIERGTRSCTVQTFITLINAMGYDMEVVKIDE